MRTFHSIEALLEYLGNEEAKHEPEIYRNLQDKTFI
jgi:hypothetical protein